MCWNVGYTFEQLHLRQNWDSWLQKKDVNLQERVKILYKQVCTSRKYSKQQLCLTSCTEIAPSTSRSSVNGTIDFQNLAFLSMFSYTQSFLNFKFNTKNSPLQGSFLSRFKAIFYYILRLRFYYFLKLYFAILFKTIVYYISRLYFTRV